MGGKREKPEDIVLKLRQVEVLQGQGKPLEDEQKAAFVKVILRYSGNNMVYFVDSSEYTIEATAR